MTYNGISKNNSPNIPYIKNIETAFIIEDHLLFVFNLIFKKYILIEAQTGNPPNIPDNIFEMETHNIS